jgi:hypothetical protein|tara:strand:+ start:1225 stop:1371 length:147 start_codon:yes stop_codon:yes gene_type:complete
MEQNDCIRECLGLAEDLINLLPELDVIDDEIYDKVNQIISNLQLGIKE